MKDNDMVRGGQLLAKSFKEKGIEHVFTLAGGFCNPALEGFMNHQIPVINCPHEQQALRIGLDCGRNTCGNNPRSDLIPRKPFSFQPNPAKSPQNLTPGRLRHAKSESEVENVEILHPDVEIKENHVKKT